jgi:HK97 gp10 family phage protein
MDYLMAMGFQGGFVVDVNVEGARAIEAWLKEVKFDLAGKKMRGALRKGAEIVRDVATATAPVSRSGRHASAKYPAHEAGNLRDSLKIQAAPIKNRDNVVVHVGLTKDAFYWRWVEFGKHDQQAYPFLRPALDMSEGEATKRIGAFLRNSMKRYRTARTRGRR